MKATAVGKDAGREFRDLVVAQVQIFEGSFSLRQPRSVQGQYLIVSSVKQKGKRLIKKLFFINYEKKLNNVLKNETDDLQTQR